MRFEAILVGSTRSVFTLVEVVGALSCHMGARGLRVPEDWPFSKSAKDDVGVLPETRHSVARWDAVKAVVRPAFGFHERAPQERVRVPKCP